jgi:hypothetical protein
LASLLDSIGRLSEVGNPSTQVRMLWAAKNLPYVDLYDLIDNQLKSKVSWVRDQALMVIAQIDPTRHQNTANLVFEVGVGLANGELFVRFASYVRAVVTAGSFRGWWCLSAAVSLSLLYVCGLCGVVWMEYLSVSRFRPVIYGPLTLVGCMLAVALLSAVFVGRRIAPPGILGLVVSTAGLAVPSVYILVEGLSQGNVATIITVGRWMASLWVWGLIACLMHVLAVVAFVALALPTRGTRRSVSDIFRAFGENYRRPLESVSQLATWSLVLILGNVLVNILQTRSPTFAHATSYIFHDVVALPHLIGDWSALPLSGDWNLIVLIGTLSIIVAINISVLFDRRRFIEDLKDWVNDSENRFFIVAVILLLAGWSFPAQSLWRWSTDLGVSGFAGYLLAYVPLPIIVLVVGGMAFWLWHSLIYRPLFVRWRVKRALRSPTLWKAELTKGDPYYQSRLLRSANHQTLGLSPSEFAVLLLGVEADVNSEPARSQYWFVRHQSEQILRQEIVAYASVVHGYPPVAKGIGPT